MNEKQSCLNGLWGDECQYNILNLDDPASTVYRVFRILFIVWAGILCFLSFSAFCYSKHQSRKNEEVKDQSRLFSSVQRLIFLVVFAKDLNILLLYSIDVPVPVPINQFKTYFKMPPVLSYIFNSMDIPFFLALFSVLIFHWLEVYLRTVNVLKKEAMLRKVNSNYQPSVTLSDIVTSISRLTRIKIPMITLIIYGFVLGFIQGILMQFSTQVSISFLLFYGISFLVLFVVEGVGYLVIGNYMVSVLPEKLKSKVKKVTIKFSILALYFVFFYTITWPISWRINGVSPAGFVVIFIITLSTSLLFTTIVFFHFVRFRRQAPFFYFIGNGTSKTVGTNSAEMSNHGSLNSATDSQNYSDPNPELSVVVEPNEQGEVVQNNS